MFADCDGHAVDAEHQRQQQWHIYVVYVSLLVRHARFALEGICKSMAIEIRVVLIHSRDFRGFSHVQVCISGDTPYLFLPGFLRFSWVGIDLGHLFSLRKNAERSREGP